MTATTLASTLHPSQPIVPIAASNAGYGMQTFGPGLALGSNWFNFNLLAVTPIRGQSVQNSDGSVLLTKDGSNFGGGICTARKVGNNWSGIAFGGGFYTEATLAFTPTLGSPTLPFPAFWSDEIKFLNGNAPQWPGQSVGYSHWVELDFMQWPHNSLAFWAGASIADWYNNPAVALGIPNNGLIPMSVPFTNQNTYGCLWVPATTTTQGYIRNYFNGVQVFYAVGVPSLITWNKYNSGNAPPPVIGTTAASILDTQHMALILGTDVTCPMTVTSVSVWQSDTSNNLVQ